MSLLTEAQAIKDELIDIRRKLHQYPELSFQEYETTAYIKNVLNTIKGITVQTGKDEIGLNTGVVGSISSGSGPTIAIRADIDALPILEENQLAYRSQNKGVMHACGHDAHTTIALGTAKILAQKMRQGELSGKIIFIFQPAEEDTDDHGFTGAPYLMKAGVLENVDAAIALHMNPEESVSTVTLSEGYSMASVDTFRAAIKGSGGHAAYPHLVKDPIRMLGSILPAIQSITARTISPLESSVISVTHIGTTPSYNVIPNEVILQGTIRSYHPAIRKQLKIELEDTLKISESMGGSYELNINHGEPVLYNHPAITNWYEQTIQSLLPSFTIKHEPFGMAGEDFSHMAETVPSAMLFLGAKKDSLPNRGLHMPEFDIDEEALIYGVTILSETVCRFLKGEYSLE
ncbi:amidohydrolase [Salinibacillus kushneri]|uniref:Amidohydrolase n=1 Tax=Salinibacillus kushneri TaxID=237682 RepID=A0A1H9YE41_9BACI|nr:amidohydrolase [Salinibacillus kushneri]SES66745.1 amidohydrolase [Salinibacillus kushneri]